MDTHTCKPMFFSLPDTQTHIDQRCRSIIDDKRLSNSFYWFLGELVLLSASCIQTCKHTHKHAVSAQDENQDTRSTETWHHQVLWPAFVRLLSQITPAFTLHFLPPSRVPCFLFIFPLSPATLLLSLLLNTSLSPHLLSLPPSLASALWKSLCWMQPELSSPLLFPGSVCLCYCLSIVQRATAKALPSLSLSFSISGCRHFLSTLIVPSKLFISFTHQNTNTTCLYTHQHI